MKKIILSITAALFAMALNAQISVWDGTAEPWSQGSGTQEDPYLIESAQNLAYLSEAVNKYYSNGEYDTPAFADTCFLMTVDIDLRGDYGFEWHPIGNEASAIGHKHFAGNFDGGGHVISKIKFYNDLISDYYGLFGCAKNGSIVNVKIDNDCMLYISTLFEFRGHIGSVLGYGENMIVENCENNANIIIYADYSKPFGATGGVCGTLLNSSINNCRNRGSINAESDSFSNSLLYGGVVGLLGGSNVTLCSNQGTVVASVNTEQGAFVGGIAGLSTGDCQMSSCYNTADLSLTAGIMVDTSCVGGLVGIVYDTLFVSDSYCAGSITCDGVIGGIVGIGINNTFVGNSYYINTILSANNFGTPKSENEMQSQDFVTLLNNGGNIYAMDDLHVNNGYPIFGMYYAVNEIVTDELVSVYPNPAKDLVHIKFSENSDCQSIEIYSIDGRLVKTCHGASLQNNGISIANLNSGVYVMKVRMSDGSEFTERIVKE